MDLLLHCVSRILTEIIVTLGTTLMYFRVLPRSYAVSINVCVSMMFRSNCELRSPRLSFFGRGSGSDRVTAKTV